MTDEEILKAFECCCGDDVNGTHCKDCPAEKYNFDWCSDEVLRQMVDYTKRLQAENAALKERLEKAVELPCKIGDRFYIVEYYPPEIIEEECCDFSFIELSKILLDNGCGVTYELGDNGCFFVTLDKNEAIRIYNQKKEEQND